MDLAIFHPWIKQRGGAEKLVLRYAQNSKHSVKIFTLFYDPESTFEEFEDVEVEVVGDRSPPGGMADRFLRFMLGNALMKIPLDSFDALLLSETGMANPLAIRNSEIPVIAYVHTPMRAALPEFKQEYRSELHPGMYPAFEIGVLFNNTIESISWSNIDFALANSSLTRERVLSKNLIEEDRIEVLNPGADQPDAEEGEYSNYFLYPSRFRRYKRQRLAVEAFQEADLPEDFRLVLAGSGQEEEYIQELREISGDKIEIKTDVSREEWENLYRNCRATVFLPQAEDWGIIPVESGMFRKPTICVNEGGVVDIIEDGESGFLINPEPSEIAEKFEVLANNPDLAAEMGEKAFHNSKSFTWEAFSKKLDEKVLNVADG